ncbi:hypothetical protein DC094_02800 [Pelagibaculum spongiae]|uniref:Uncharacterized protein n=1 Tax=Pelagibaculum spongiae TaxID=2080658 RepID=A0A2V1H419_9GAMM|nr:hypothetical protein DC094_02800 [Pelagibaculum spongiae]
MINNTDHHLFNISFIILIFLLMKSIVPFININMKNLWYGFFKTKKRLKHSEPKGWDNYKLLTNFQNSERQKTRLTNTKAADVF